MAKSDSNCASCNKKDSPLTLNRQQVGGFASTGNLGGALGASFGLAVGPSVGAKIGNRMGNTPTSSLMSFIDTPGTPGQKRSMNKKQKNNHLIKSVGLGNFSLNSSFESGLINAVGASKNSSLDFLKNSDTGSSILAASALGIEMPKADLLGTSSNDSSMFKLLKFASFGLLIMCGLLRGKQRGGPGGYNSTTEELLGLILSINIDLSLLDRLKSIFDKILGLKPNFSSFGLSDFDISDALTSLCDWVENMAYGSPTLDSFRGSLPVGQSNKNLTGLLGNKLIGEGTYDSYAKNDFGFDQQFKSISGDIDALKCDACNLGKTDIKLMQGSTPFAELEFDPRSGLQREKNPEGIIASVVGETTPEVFKGVDYVTTGSNITFDNDNLGSLDTPIGTSLTNTETIASVDSLISPANVGDTKLFVNDSTQFPINSHMKLGEGTINEECIMCKQYGSLILAEPLKNSHPIGTTVSPPYAESPCSLLKNQSQTPIGKKSVLSSIGDIEKKSDVPMTDMKAQPLNRISNDSVVPSDNIIESVKSKSPGASNISEQESGIEYKSDVDTGIVYDSGNIIKDTHESESGDIVTDTYTPDSNGEYTKTKTEVVSKKPFGGEPVGPEATEVQSYHTGKTITKEELNDTVLEDADLNAVALLAEEDLENLKDTEQVNQTLKEAEQVWDETFDKLVEETENLVLEEQSSGIIFGVQLPEILNGNQVVINSERVLISAKTQEVGIFAKRKFFVSTDDEITMNAKERIVLKTDAHTSIESPTIHLGCYTTRHHPSLKGDCTVWWLQDLCDWLSGHTHSDPWVTTGSPTQQGSLAALRARAPTLLSERIFISG